jgi:hypothetical protein
VSTPFDLGRTFVHLARAPLPDFRWDQESLSRYAEEHACDGDDGRLDGREQRAGMGSGQAITNPAGVWHTCDVHEPGRALYITPGRGTEHRPRTRNATS